MAARASCSITITIAFRPTQSGSLKGRQSRITLPVHPDISLERNIYWCQPGGEPISSQARLCLHSNRCSNRRTVVRAPSAKDWRSIAPRTPIQEGLFLPKFEIKIARGVFSCSRYLMLKSESQERRNIHQWLMGSLDRNIPFIKLARK